MKADIIGTDSSKKGSVEISDRIFASDINESNIYEAVKNQLANKRQGNASCKNRGAVHGTTRKPWRQKGTGRARVGSSKSPLWRGGGVIFGPQPRDYSYRIPKKVRQSALFSILSRFNRDKKLIVLEDFEQKEYKTRDIVDIFSKVTDGKKVMYILNSEKRDNYEKIKKSSSNIPWLKVVNSKSIELKDLYYSEQLVISKDTIEELNKRYT